MHTFRQFEIERRIDQIIDELEEIKKKLAEDNEEDKPEPSIIDVMVVIEDEREKFWTMYEGPLDKIPEQYNKYHFEVVRGHRSNELTLFAKDKRENIDTEHALSVIG